MILVTGSLEGTAETIDRLIALALDHVGRSRREDGCISHDVHRHVEQPDRLVFIEQWRDMDALLAHFAVPESRAFVAQAAALASKPPTIAIHEATAIPFALGGGPE